MLDYIRSILPSLNMEANDFNTGYFFALFVVGSTLLALFIIRVIIKIIFRKKRCHSINIQSDNGDAVISCSAIMAVIKALENEFNALTINKVNLFRYRNRPFLEVYIDFDASKGGLPSHSEKFKLRVIESLDALFGIRNIRKVHLHLRHVQLHNADILKTRKIPLDNNKTAEISVGNLELPDNIKKAKAAAEKKEKTADDKAEK
ncbi:MAG: hypothetical protein PHV82_12640 [Victivallaceae bacterium]|nr:hypothetical protein [Victivallaceae bacterium]